MTIAPKLAERSRLDVSSSSGRIDGAESAPGRAARSRLAETAARTCRFALFAALILGCAFDGAALDEPFEGATPSCGHELVYEPFAGLILVGVTIADSPPMDFVLDSGATQSAITDPYLARALGLEVREAGLARGIGSGATRVAITEDTSIHADGVELLRVSLVVHDIGVSLSENAGRDIHGFLGAELFERYVVEIDPATRRLLLHDPETFSYDGLGTVLPLEVEDRRPVVEGSVVVEAGDRPVSVRLMVDTGSSRNLTLISHSRRRLRPPSGAVASPSIGVVGPATVLVAPVARLELGPAFSEGLETSWTESYQVPAVRRIEDLNGILGNGLLSRLRTVFDYQRGRLILVPR
jgi:hypothetical protein